MRLGCVIPSRRIVAALLALACGAAIAQAPDARLQALEAELGELKKRVELLEGRQPAPKTANTVKAPIAAAAPGDCSRWEHLEMSLTQPEVKAILGEPAKVDATPLQIVWRYPCGRAYFDGESKRFLGYER